MNRIKVDEEKNKTEHTIGAYNYIYKFRCMINGLEHNPRKNENMHMLENFHGFGVDARGILYELLLKDFAIELRKNIFYEDYEFLVTHDLSELITTESLKK